MSMKLVFVIKSADSVLKFVSSFSSEKIACRFEGSISPTESFKQTQLDSAAFVHFECRKVNDFTICFS